MMKKILLGMSLVVCFSKGICGEAPVAIVGTAQETVQSSTVQASHRALQMMVAPKFPKKVTLLKLRLSEATKKTLKKRVSQLERATLKGPATQHYPRQIQLGMNGVPVLNQGTHGTCAVFAVTAALDAVLGKGDYISQLCQLQLGRYLNNNGYTESGWEGAWGQDIFDKIAMFGVVPKSLEASGACSGLLAYPLSGNDASEELNLFDYHQMSESLQDQDIIFSPLAIPEQINSYIIDTENILYHVKRSLNQGDRITLGVGIPDYTTGNVGALGSHHVANDTWVMSPNMFDMQNADQFGGHALVITGYDDDAVAIDPKGRFHRGLLTLRNSWGSNVGDKGDFYMSYSYFKTFVLEAYRVQQNHQEPFVLGG